MKKTEILFIVVCIFWAGMVTAISFLEAPLKFTAPNITLLLGLGIGRIVFQALNKIELLFLIISSISFLYIRKSKLISFLFYFTTLILLYQSLYLLPQLDKRAIALLNNEQLPSSTLHWQYIFLDILKVSTLIFLVIKKLSIKIKLDEGYTT